MYYSVYLCKLQRQSSLPSVWPSCDVLQRVLVQTTTAIVSAERLAQPRCATAYTCTNYNGISLLNDYIAKVVDRSPDPTVIAGNHDKM